MLNSPLTIHLIRYQNGNQRFFLDADSGVFAESSELLDELFPLIPDHTPTEIMTKLSGRFEEQEIRNYLIELGQLYDQNVLFVDTYSPKYARLMGERPQDGMPYLHLNLAHDCNLRCVYCFGHGGDFSGCRTIMSKEVAKKCIDFWSAQLNPDKAETVTITFFGGEPLLNKPVFKYTIEYITEKFKNTPKEVRYNLTTNATILDEEILDILIHNNINPLISMDGAREIQDSHRPYASGKGSYQIVRQNVQKLSSHFNLKARITLSKNGVPHFTESVQHLWDLGFAEVSYALVAIADPKLSLNEKDMEILLPQITELRKITYQNILSNKYHYLTNLMEIGFAIQNRIFNHPCEFYNCSSLKFTPDGSIYKCHRMLHDEALKVGDVDQGIHWEMYLACKRLTLPVGCQQCDAKPFCYGGCAQENYVYQQNFTIPYEIHCREKRHLFHEGLKLYTDLYIRSAENTADIFRK